MYIFPVYCNRLLPCDYDAHLLNFILVCRPLDFSLGLIHTLARTFSGLESPWVKLWTVRCHRVQQKISAEATLNPGCVNTIGIRWKLPQN